ncbi:MAG: hypothetical protein HFF08_03650 [Oscillospiraceae bacterium]|nr:hypothetical protein [Oscillospiraceae bacterium]
MDFSMIGSIRNYTKALDLQTKWDQKKKSGDVTAHMTERDWIQQQVDEDRGKDKLRSIKAKLEAGGKLTGEERKYLQSKDPEAYQELEDQEREQKEYERALKRCKTKEDVQRLKASRVGAALTKLKAIENNPNIPLEKKLKIFMAEKCKMDKFEESTQKFVKRGEYEQLPTENETAKAEKEQREAAEIKLTTGTEKSAKDCDGKPEEKAPSGGERASAAEQAEKPDVKQESPEARKVRRAKAKAAYAEQVEPPGVPAAQTLDIRS